MGSFLASGAADGGFKSHGLVRRRRFDLKGAYNCRCGLEGVQLKVWSQGLPNRGLVLIVEGAVDGLVWKGCSWRSGLKVVQLVVKSQGGAVRVLVSRGCS